jgi:hypothetical protein
MSRSKRQKKASTRFSPNSLFSQFSRSIFPQTRQKNRTLP